MHSEYNTMEETIKSMDTDFGEGGGQTIKAKVFDRINILNIRPNEELGQHFLIDDVAIGTLAQAVTPGNTVIEVGAGVGQLTDVLAQKAGKVVAIEIDRRYEAVLDEVAKENSNVQIVYADVLTVKFQDLIKGKKKKPQDEEGVQVVASLPYHITEPFLHKLVGLPLESATLVIGQRLARAIQAHGENDPSFGQLTLLTQTFFDIQVLAQLEKQKFFPIPRTDSVIVRLIPRERDDFRTNKRDFLLRRLFLTSKDSPLVKNALREGLIEYVQESKMMGKSKREHNKKVRSAAKIELKEATVEFNHTGNLESKSGEDTSSQLTKNQARAIIDRMEIPEEILDKPFEQLNNNDLKVLSKSLSMD